MPPSSRTSRLQHRFGHGRPGRALSVIGARKFAVGIAAASLVAVLAIAYRSSLGAPSQGELASEARGSAALTITTSVSERHTWPSTIEISGPIQPWQEAIVGAPLSGLRLSGVDVEVGDRVVKGQILARFDDSLLRAEVNRLDAALAQAQALAQQARQEAARAELLRPTGALSEQSILAVTTQAQVANAAVRSARAALDAKRIEHSYSLLRASDDGVISSRLATVGAVPEAGEELFRLVRQGRLDWRGEATAHRLAGIEKGQSVEIQLPDGSTTEAKVRVVAPTLEESSRTAIVYADVPASSTARAGMYARGSIRLGESPALVVPAAAISDQDGRSRLFVLETDDGRSRVRAVPVRAGRRMGPYVEIVSGIDAGAIVAVEGAGFLSDGDIVKVAASAQPMVGSASVVAE